MKTKGKDVTRLPIILLLFLAATACGNADQTAGVNADKTQEKPSDSREAVSGEWLLSHESTAMDAEVISASRTYPFPNDTALVVDVICKRPSDLSLSVRSFVGDPDSPSDESKFVLQQVYDQMTGSRTVPVGRVKLGGNSPADLTIFHYLEVGDYANEVKFAVPLQVQNFPMTLELKNGVGTLQLVIDAAAPVLQAVDACTAPNREVTVEPSFDCKAANSRVESLICEDSILSTLDRTMSENYGHMIAAGLADDVRNELISSQRDWLASRDSCTDRDCLFSMYRERLDAVCNYPTVGESVPECTRFNQL
jgi:uncharacterized protein YecT (DUF1311 family)